MQRTPVIGKHVSAARREQIVADYQRSQLTQRELARYCGIGLSTTL
jgi:transposase-like protein